MLKRLLFAAVVLSGTAAHATPTLTNLFTAIQASGTSIVIDDPTHCKDPSTMGMYVYQPGVQDQLTVCIENHKGNSAELYDTILHESVHVAQACKGGNLFTQHSILSASTGIEVATVKQFYPNHQHDRELEARVIARENDEVFVTNLIKQHCK